MSRLGEKGSNWDVDQAIADAAQPGGPHTHGQDDITDLDTALAAKQATSEKGQANGYASLDATGKVPSAQLPASGAVTITEVEVDFSYPPIRSKAFTVVDAAVTTSSKVMVSQSGGIPTGKGDNESEMDPIQCSAIPGNGSFTLIAAGIEGKVAGAFKFLYTVA